MGQVRMMISAGVVALAGATAFGIGASVSSTPSMMSRGDYEAAKVAIAAESRELSALCDTQRGTSRQVCLAETRGREEILLAELESRYRGTVTAGRDAAMVRVRAKYEIERSRCSAYAGFKRDSCVVSAHAERARSLMALKTEG